MTMENKSEVFTFTDIPENVTQLKALPEANLQDAYGTAALCMAALLRYEADTEATVEMLNFLKGPEPVSNYEKQFLRDRLSGKQYKVGSFFEGATTSNGYTPSKPYKITVSSNPYSFDEANYAVMYVTSAGADSPRPIKLRKKPSTGEWFVCDIQCLSDIRVPAAQDPWA